MNNKPAYQPTIPPVDMTRWSPVMSISEAVEVVGQTGKQTLEMLGHKQPSLRPLTEAVLVLNHEARLTQPEPATPLSFLNELLSAPQRNHLGAAGGTRSPRKDLTQAHEVMAQAPALIAQAEAELSASQSPLLMELERFKFALNDQLAPKERWTQRRPKHQQESAHGQTSIRR